MPGDASQLKRPRFFDSPICSDGDRGLLRETDLIRAPQRSPPTNEVCQDTSYGFAPDPQAPPLGFVGQNYGKTLGRTMLYAGDVSGLPFGTTMNTTARAGASAFADPTEV
jgi:hypothetical protein